MATASTRPSTGSACTPRCGSSRTTASGWSNRVVASPGRRCRASPCNSTPQGRWSWSSRHRGATAPCTWCWGGTQRVRWTVCASPRAQALRGRGLQGWARWSSCSGWQRWCHARGCTWFDSRVCWPLTPSSACGWFHRWCRKSQRRSSRKQSLPLCEASW